MPGYILDGPTSISCPHGGTATASPRTSSVKLGGQPPLVLDDFASPQPVISGCSFMLGNVPSPCMRLQWLMPAMKVKAQSSPVLLSSSIALCLSAAGAPQGTAMVSGYQTKVKAQ